MFVFYINIPMNDIGITELERYEEEMPNVKTFSLSLEEYNSLNRPGGLFHKFKEKLGVMIDICEEERINYDNLEKALKIANKHLSSKKTDNVEIDGTNIVIESLECAVHAGTFWEIDIFLEG